MTKPSRAELEYTVKIVKRADFLGLIQIGPFTAMMDIGCAHQHFNLDLPSFLAAKDFDFIHDFCGIQNNIDREKATFDSYFVPRFARP